MPPRSNRGPSTPWTATPVWPSTPSPSGSGAGTTPSSPSTASRSRSRTGEFVCLVGASGCGKTTLLNLVAGLDHATPARSCVERQGRPDVPGGGAVPVADRGRATSSWRCGCAGVPRGRAPDAGRRAARAGPPRRLRRQAAARAVRRHAPARRPGPGPRPGGRRPAHGRAVRRPRRDDPRPAARRARAHLEGDAGPPSCSSPTTCARRPGSATGSCCSPAGPGGSPPSSPSTSTGPRRIEAPDVVGPGRRGHRPAARGGAPPWPVAERQLRERQRAGARRPRRPRDRRRERATVAPVAGLGLAVAEARSPSASSSAGLAARRRGAAGSRSTSCPAPVTVLRPAVDRHATRPSSGTPSPSRCSAPSIGLRAGARHRRR